MLRDRALVPLSQQHHNGLALCVVTSRSLEGEIPAETVARIASKVVDRFDLEIANHFAIEEDIVFPAVERELGEYPSIGEFVSEHRRLEELVEHLRTAADVETLRSFIDLLRSHIRREESELFEDIQQRLTRKTLDELGVQIDTRAVRIAI
jgi:hemerythrin-like domain-containing protein